MRRDARCLEADWLVVEVGPLRAGTGQLRASIAATRRAVDPGVFRGDSAHHGKMPARSRARIKTFRDTNGD
jgi:hypothetical protein